MTEDDTSVLWTMWYNSTALKGVPSMVDWISDNKALAIENWTDEEVLEHVMRKLRSMFTTMQKPDEAIHEMGSGRERVWVVLIQKNDPSFGDNASNLKERAGNVWFAS